MMNKTINPKANKQEAGSDTLIPFCKTQGSGKHQVVLIHGFGINHKSWYDVCPLLSEHATLHMVDLIGCGDSPTPLDWPYTIEAQADALMNFIIGKNLKDITLAGHSYGGGVALMLFHKMMENQNGLRIKKLILIAPAAYPQVLPFFIAIPSIPFIGNFALKVIPPQLLVKTALWKAMYNKKALTQERISRYKTTLNPPKRMALIRTAQNIIPKETESLVDMIKETHVEALLIYGQKERVVSKENLERLSFELPDCITKKIAGCGHIPHEEYPELTAGIIIDFLCR